MSLNLKQIRDSATNTKLTNLLAVVTFFLSRQPELGLSNVCTLLWQWYLRCKYLNKPYADVMLNISIDCEKNKMNVFEEMHSSFQFDYVSFYVICRATFY